MRKIYTAIILFVTLFSGYTQDKTESPLENLPDYIQQLTFFGERADWSLDGKKVLFLEKHLVTFLRWTWKPELSGQ